MKKQIIIGRELSVAETDQIRLQEETEIICLDEYKFPFASKTIALSAEEKRDINYSVLDEIKNLGDKLINGYSVVQHLQTEKSSIWHYHKFRTYFFVRNLSYERAKLAKISFPGNGQISFYCPAEFRLLQDEFPQLKFIFPVRKKEKLNIQLSLKYLFFLKLRIISSWFVGCEKSGILIYYPERYNPLLDLESLQQKEGNFLLDYLFTQAKSPLNLLGEVPVPKLKSKTAFPFHRGYFKVRESGHPKKNMESILVRFGLPAYREAKGAGKKLIAKYPELLSGSLSANEKLAIRFIQSLHSSSIYYLTRYFASKRFFSKNKFRVVLATDENSPLTKSVLDAAKFHGIKTVGMQHGTMHDLHPAYLYTKNDIAAEIIPDFTLVWGTYWEQFLIEKGNYPADSVISVGHLRTDIIPKLLSQQQEKNTDFRLVFASQPQRDPVLRRQAAFDVFSATRLFPEIELIVKLHPREYDDETYYRAIAADAACINYRIDKSTDLYELIASCDALITCFSTVGTETVYFSKPLIILDHLMQDIQGYYKEGVAFRAINAQQLSEIISGLKNGQLTINQHAYASFTDSYSYRIDGKVAERISGFLKSI
ncbi:MAG: hypothetical protein A2W90_07485 [Bacteroidetes bacterium GWF2_42_66]|nr:MAG: hypothetical protein A2W92_07475 [Bacteroidetes bacterium GWA2_42_15]OFX96931.1 MAG: hypothetical protein A2W89_20185 [Bacteroidetes bacterium GWE2_42_39]OFY44688.1 MAG: hypothetical protein A2W90_07485 [Bacteroidetes bacterium GWF2_42_66]HBL75024.1 hypothetical protein [Prolixibacteraceae bacterium]HCR92162.1 hypothetical protein [Prolixibacteraceae bacterium]